jgi:hypothetical protein
VSEDHDRFLAVLFGEGSQTVERCQKVGAVFLI